MATTTSCGTTMHAPISPVAHAGARTLIMLPIKGSIAALAS